MEVKLRRILPEEKGQKNRQDLALELAINCAKSLGYDGAIIDNSPNEIKDLKVEIIDVLPKESVKYVGLHYFAFFNNTMR